MLSVPHHYAPFQEQLELLFNTIAGHPHYMRLSKTGLGNAKCGNGEQSGIYLRFLQGNLGNGCMFLSQYEVRLMDSIEGYRLLYAKLPCSSQTLFA